MSPDARPLPPGTQRGSAIMIALFVIVIMALLAAAMGRFLVDSGEKHGVEVRGVRALMAAQSGLEIALYRLYPNDHWQARQCDALTLTTFAVPGLVDCEAEVSCQRIAVSAAGGTQTGYRFRSEGRCGGPRQSGPSPDFAVSRTLVAKAFDGTTP
ncbi:MSHA biogenesis protein MshP [Aeromonas sanarellii]|uniref:MSHA biogenesis protein MshP n=1 Tax=Aeromonas sanarellii TaxID=633415 RepID=UPI0038D1A143